MSFPVILRCFYFPAQQFAEAAATVIDQNEQAAHATTSQNRMFLLLVMVLVLYTLRRAIMLASYLRRLRQANENGDVEIRTVKQPEDMEEFIDALPLTICGKQTKEIWYDLECVVCLEKFEVGDRCRVLQPCGHTYHMICIDKWLFRSISCPLCRNIVRVDL